MAFLTALAVGSLVYSTVQQARAQHKQGQAAAEAGRAQNEAAQSDANRLEFNANVADLQAEDALQRGVDTESRTRQQIRGVLGAQRATLAGNGVDVGFGSAVDVQADAAYLGELDALTVRNNAAREAWGFRQAAADTRMQADIVRRGGTAAVAAGELQRQASNTAMAGTIVGGAGQTVSLLNQRYGWGSTTGRTTGTRTGAVTTNLNDLSPRTVT